MIDWETFAIRFSKELERLGVSDQEARFVGFDAADERIFPLLASLPDGAGVEAFYKFLGADFAELEKREREGLTR
jgi:hypothetical protein